MALEYPCHSAAKSAKAQSKQAIAPPKKNHPLPATMSAPGWVGSAPAIVRTCAGATFLCRINNRSFLWASSVAVVGSCLGIPVAPIFVGAAGVGHDPA